MNPNGTERLYPRTGQRKVQLGLRVTVLLGGFAHQLGWLTSLAGLIYLRMAMPTGAADADDRLNMIPPALILAMGAATIAYGMRTGLSRLQFLKSGSLTRCELLGADGDGVWVEMSVPSLGGSYKVPTMWRFRFTAGDGSKREVTVESRHPNPDWLDYQFRRDAAMPAPLEWVVYDPQDAARAIVVTGEFQSVEITDGGDIVADCFLGVASVSVVPFLTICALIVATLGLIRP